MLEGWSWWTRSMTWELWIKPDSSLTEYTSTVTKGKPGWTVSSSNDWMLEVELFDTGALRTEEATNMPAISTFVPPNLKTRLGSVTALPCDVEIESARRELLLIESTGWGTSEMHHSSPTKFGTGQSNNGDNLRYLQIWNDGDDYEQGRATSQ